jgi:UDP-N-acetylglucosamine 2-epimerase (non-hydrolysing)
LTVRENTERPVTITIGTNVLVGRDTAVLMSELSRILRSDRKVGGVPPLWDGHAAERIAKVIVATTKYAFQEHLLHSIL